MTADYRDRAYVSQYAGPVLGLQVYVAGVLADPDGAAVSATLVAEATGTAVFTRAATHASAGVFAVALASAETAAPGNYTLVFTYLVAGVTDNYAVYLTVGAANPDYDFLAQPMKDLVESVWHRFLDLFDSPDGGPNMATYIQSRWSRGRMAQLLRIAVGTLNTVAQPYQGYTIDGNGGAAFPIAQWGPLLERSLYVEALKHLCRTYVEQPELATGAQITRLDRRDYLDRWTQVLQMELPVLKAELDTFKIANMGLGRPRVLVSGGVFGRYAPTRMAGAAAARPRMYSRFY